MSPLIVSLAGVFLGSILICHRQIHLFTNSMHKFHEHSHQIVYRYAGTMAPAAAAASTALGVVMLSYGQAGVLWALAVIIFSLGILAVGYDRSEFRFNAATREVTGWRKRFTHTETFRISFSELRAIDEEIVRGYPTTYRITLVTDDARVPLKRTYSSDHTTAEQAERIRAWFARHGVPLADGGNDDDRLRHPVPAG